MSTSFGLYRDSRGNYHARRLIPPTLHPTLGRRELRRPLSTKDRREAARRRPGARGEPRR
ncbi:MAG: DUF6538 domain-containing protein [Gammaproteobacteria bacterium]